MTQRDESHSPTAKKTVEARGSASTRPAAVSRDRHGDSGPAPGADLTRQGAQALTREGRRNDQSQGPRYERSIRVRLTDGRGLQRDAARDA